jgi:hypothetical protein
MEPIVIDRSADFTGEWRMDERESVIQYMGPTSTPYKLTITQKNNELNVKAVSVVEWADDEVTDQTYFLDGREMNSVVFNNSPRVQHANWSTEKDTLTITSRVNLNFGDRPVELNSKDVWALGKRGKKLVIFQTADGFMGRPQRESTIIYYKQ